MSNCTLFLSKIKNFSLFVRSFLFSDGPESVSLSPLKTSYTVTEGKETISITCTADCKPACDYTWSGPNVPGGTGEVLSLQNIRKNQRGVFNCAASNNVGSFNSTDVNIDVQCE